MKNYCLVPVGLVCAALGATLALALPAHSQGTEERPQQDRLRALAGLTPITNYVPLSSSSLANGASATWFLDPNKGRVITCNGNAAVGIRCASAEIPAQ
jgi:hypothetical protein